MGPKDSKLHDACFGLAVICPPSVHASEAWSQCGDVERWWDLEEVGLSGRKVTGGAALGKIKVVLWDLELVLLRPRCCKTLSLDLNESLDPVLPYDLLLSHTLPL
jgi:hypothetical protein